MVQRGGKFRTIQIFVCENGCMQSRVACIYIRTLARRHSVSINFPALVFCSSLFSLLHSLSPSPSCACSRSLASLLAPDFAVFLFSCSLSFYLLVYRRMSACLLACLIVCLSVCPSACVSLFFSLYPPHPPVLLRTRPPACSLSQTPELSIGVMAATQR